MTMTHARTIHLRDSPMRILIGTSNPGKVEEFREMLVAEGFSVITLADLDIPSIEETGTTFEENALLKASSYAADSGLITIADDGGLEIDALKGAPGVYSRRWTGDENATDEALARAVIERMRGVLPGMRTARLRTVVAMAYPDGRTRTVTEAIEGAITADVDLSRIRPGYPYRALFQVSRFHKLFADLTPEEHAEVNHRKAALRQFIPGLHATEAISVPAAFLENR